MKKVALGIDVGTTNVLAMLLDESGKVTGKVLKKFKLHYPAPGRVEQNPETMWAITIDAVHNVFNTHNISPADVGAIGITGQRSTIVIWERKTGRPLGPAIIWQDLRGSRRADELTEMGFITVNALAAASKLELALAAIPDGYGRMKNGELAWGNVDSYMAFRLSGGSLHATDASNACGTGYFNFFDGWHWIYELLKAQNLEPSFFPEVMDTAGILGYTEENLFGKEIPIGAIIGDQQCAAYAQGCLEPGEAKISFGTSGTCNVNTGKDIKLATGTYPLVLWSRGGEKIFCLEGMVITAGSVFGWLSEIGMIQSPGDVQELVRNIDNANGVFFLPALQGLGTPHNQYDRTAAFHGLTLAASKGHLVRAALEGVAFRVREMLERIYADSGLPAQEILRVDGGATENDIWMQIHADILGMRIERMDPAEATAYGAAILAGEACGIWEPYSAKKLRRTDKIFEPKWSKDQRDSQYHDWKKTFGL